MTNGEPHERVILHIQPLDCTDKDGDHCAETARHLKALGLSIHGLGYDMALDTPTVEQLQIDGILPITKVRRDRNGSPAHRLIAQQEFQLADHATRTIDVHAIDGTPYILGMVDGTELLFRLDRIKFERRRGCAFTVYRVPDQPGLSATLRGATVRIRTTSTQAEISRRERRGRALRPLSQADPAFRDLYGPREGVESTNSHWKSRLPGRRQRTIGRTAQRCNANGYQLAQNLTAALAWHLRTGGDLSCIWRNGIPPGILPDPVGLAA